MTESSKQTSPNKGAEKASIPTKNREYVPPPPPPPTEKR